LSSAQNTELARSLDLLSRKVKNEIRDALPQIADEKFVELAGEVHDAGDESVASMLEESHQILLERHLRELRRIDLARSRLAGGEIDRCTDCGGDIVYARLRVYPVATRCVRCQNLYEKTYNSEMTPKL
jgi:RNA polymerase-binding transcription factor DksA